jgi:hypothetical protein
MKVTLRIIVRVVLLCTSLLGICYVGLSQGVPFLDASQSNLVFVVNALRSDSPPNPPPIFTNTISNTNLFSLADQNLLKEIRLAYKSVATNAGPPGSILVDLKDENNHYVAKFQFTNYDARAEITFSSMKSVKFRTGSGDGYDVDVSMKDGAILNFRQIKRDLVDGLYANFYDDHCVMWMRFEKGKAVGRWLIWGAGNSLLLEAEFKEPYDFFQHAAGFRP